MAVNIVIFIYARLLKNEQNKLVPLKPEFYSNKENTSATTTFHSYTIQITLETHKIHLNLYNNNYH